MCARSSVSILGGGGGWRFARDSESFWDVYGWGLLFWQHAGWLFKGLGRCRKIKQPTPAISCAKSEKGRSRSPPIS